jgi:acetate kinase
VYVYRIRKYIGAFFAVLGKVDALVFTAGVGENSPVIRERCCRGLGGLGIGLDGARNRGGREPLRVISEEGSPVKVLVVPTDEELVIARETMKSIGKGPLPGE